MEILPRSAWGAKPPESVTLWNPKDLKGVVVHWFGSPRGKPRHEDCPALLRSVQRSHQAGEFNDIAYNHGVCSHGVCYELRGFHVQTGANGTRETNRNYAACVVMIGAGDKFSGEAKLGLSYLIAEWRLKGAGLEVLKHSETNSTSCPGPDVSKWVDEARYEPEPTPWPQPVPDWFWEWAEWRLGEGAYAQYGPKAGPRPKSAPYFIPPWAWLRLRALLAARK